MAERGNAAEDLKLGQGGTSGKPPKMADFSNIIILPIIFQKESVSSQMVSFLSPKQDKEAVTPGEM